MSTSQSWNKLSAVLTEVLNGSLKKGDVKTVMDAWNSKKTEVSKLVGSTERTTKKKKDPNAPKRPKTGYILFCGEKREEVKSKNKNMSATEITSKLAELWKKISEKDKKKYETLAQEDKQRYEKELEEYTPPSDVEEDSVKKGKKSKKERTGPKRPMSAYLYFCQESREAVKTEFPEMKGKEVTSELGKRWSALSESEKKPYEQKHETDKKRYENEKEDGTDSQVKPSAKKTKNKEPEEQERDEKEEVQSVPSKNKSKKTEKKVELKTETKPNKKTEKKSENKSKSTPGFEAFCEEQTSDVMEENPNWSEKKVRTELEKKWKDLSAEDKDAYEEEALMTLTDGSDVEAEMEDD
jgi:high mobility group protein B3